MMGEAGLQEVLGLCTVQTLKIHRDQNLCVCTQEQGEEEEEEKEECVVG